MMQISDEDIELRSIDRFGSIEPNFLQKKHKNNQKIRKSSGTVRFENFLKFDSFTVLKYSDFGRTRTVPHRSQTLSYQTLTFY
jgi:hypothetical protein